ncbi:MAG: ABC transporter ATP-binding protein [Candidatus Eremiobacteraeota bacterium]|nr:ABC transporter ATP-binding protein [Candidatus Eremiobacteraeota bacterium]
MRQPVLLSGVVKTYENDVRALAGVDLAVARGELVALVGPSGCGKSTLLNLVGCIDLPTSGIVEIDGVSTSTLGDKALTALRRERIGTVFQFFNLLPTLSIRDNVALPLVLRRAGVAEIDERVDRTLRAVGISEKSSSLPGSISGGQLQRAAIARAIVHEPAILLADEPTGNLDSRNGDMVLDLLRALADGGQAILMATHSADAAARADRRVHMRDGRIEAIS